MSLLSFLTIASRSSAISTELGRLAREAHVELAGVKYNESMADPAVPDLTLVEVDAQVSAKYQDLVHFINSAERDHMFFVVDGITLADQKGGEVRLEIKMETYLRPPTTAELKAPVGKAKHGEDEEPQDETPIPPKPQPKQKKVSK